MFKIAFYKDIRGKEPVKEYFDSLLSKKDKDSRVKFSKITDYLGLLEKNGTRIGQPFVKHIEGDIWELRPLKDRVFFFFWSDNTFVLLHYFQKKTPKTPAKEIEQAKRNMQDFINRS